MKGTAISMIRSGLRYLTAPLGIVLRAQSASDTGTQCPLKSVCVVCDGRARCSVARAAEEARIGYVRGL
ncbi:MAG TPA: hypothetical protein VFA95_06280 [Gammaproteobacteria bacterium]|nr:hypothetical protein [Gammaproteobacteria bacterium]